MKSYLIIIVFFVSANTHAQVDVNRFQNILQSVSSGSAAYGAGMQGRYNNTMEVIGDVYLDSTFTSTSFLMKGNAPSLVTPARYDILNREFEVKTTGGVRVLNGDFVKSFKKYKNGDSVTYVNASNYKFLESPLVGFLQVLSSGSVELLALTRLDVVKPSYNPSLEVGDKNAYVNKKETLYYSVKSELFRLKGKKEILEVFGSDKNKVEAFVNSNKLGFKKTDDLKQVFDFYNSRPGNEN
jgi:hypothetical protein